jgi:two-component system chemotaxis response regulator CheB
MKKTKVLVVDDSAVVRQLLSEELGKVPWIEVCGTAIDPYAARDKLVTLQPDVLTLDIEMPRMDGISFLEKLMRHRPTPVVVVSSLTPQNSETAMRALAAGAIAVVAKPQSQFSIPDVLDELVAAIRQASQARLVAPTQAPRAAAAAPTARGLAGLSTTDKLIAIGSSTGGPAALEQVLTRMPTDAPGIVIVQHMPQSFTGSFSRHLDTVCKIEVREAKDGDSVIPGLALIAPGGRHMVLSRSGAQYVVRLEDGPPEHYQRPAADVLLRSVAKHAGRNAVGAILTGMGEDGAEGLLAMRNAGAHTMAQDEASCVVYGMPRRAAELGAAAEIVPLDRITSRLLDAVRRSAVKV